MIPRVALFADTFTEVNGAANVLRKLTEYAKAKDHPLLCVHSGSKTELKEDGSVSRLELKRNRFTFALDSELRYDPLFWKHNRHVGKILRDFKPDVLHVTGPNDVSQIGLVYAHFKSLPAIASWHTNAHEYAAKRASGLISWLPKGARCKTETVLERAALSGLMKLLFLAQIQLAPNEELVELLRKRTKRPSFLMSRGVDTEQFDPRKRVRTDDVLTLGYVGRLRPEKNVRLLADVEKELARRGLKDYRFLIVGDGSEEEFLRQNLSNADFRGVLRGEELARAYAEIDLFIFPSKTDAFGNVVLEAMASGVPSVVLPDNGPRFLVEQNVTGYIARDEADLVRYAADFVADHSNLGAMQTAARKRALNYSWERVFETVYEHYKLATTLSKKVRAKDLGQIH